MSESETQSEILQWLKENGYFAWRNHTQGIRYTKGRGTNPNKGAPDIMAIRNGVFFGIEVKGKKGVLGPDQYKWLDKLQSRGGVAIVTDSLAGCINQIGTEMAIR